VSYLTPTEFRLRSFASGSFDELSDAEVQVQLDVAASEIDAALRPHHTLPMATPYPAVLLEAESVMTAYRLFLFRGFKPGSKDADTIQARYFEVVGDPTAPGSGLLGRLAAGKFILADSADSTPQRREGAPVVLSRPSRSDRWV